MRTVRRAVYIRRIDLATNVDAVIANYRDKSSVFGVRTKGSVSCLATMFYVLRVRPRVNPTRRNGAARMRSPHCETYTSGCPEL